MTDRELLEFAAKAAGMEVEPSPNGWEETYPMGWNPLQDDGDALRLAVKLGIFSLEILPEEISAAFFNNDPYAATRRAIVRVAAEIGRSIE